MAKILCIETSTEVCSVALTVNKEVVDFIEDLKGQSHSKLLTVFIDELLKRNNLKVSGLDAVAVSKGPGSYTGLRIGVSVAKGICYAASLPLIVVCPLEAMAHQVIQQQRNLKEHHQQDYFFVPMIDARRMEVYMAIFNLEMVKSEDVTATVIEESTFNKYCDTGNLFLFGNGAQKCKGVLKNERIHFIDGVYASAKNMAEPAYGAFANKDFADLAYFEPFYLKDFIATVPKNSVLGKR